MAVSFSQVLQYWLDEVSEICMKLYSDLDTDTDLKGTDMIDTDTSKIVATATEKQKSFIASLLVKHTGYREEFGVRVIKAMTKDTLPRDKASEIIDWLLAKPLRVTAGTKPAKPAKFDDLPDVPAGHYAVKSMTGNNDLDFFRVDRPVAPSKWAGRTFVKRIIGGHSATSVSFTETRKALDAIIAAGASDAATRYGVEIGRCYKCNRTLTDELSRTLGIGPHCRAGGVDH